MKRSELICCVAVQVALFAAGCGSAATEPELAVVYGTITVNGAPGTDLDVVFEPQSGATGNAKEIGASSTARTDAEGYYELTYKGIHRGAVVGKHVVRIATAAGGGPAGGENGAVSAYEIPSEYGNGSTLIRDVKKGENSIDLEVKTSPN